MPKKKKLIRLAPNHQTDWKFVIILVVLGIIALGVFSIYKSLAFTQPEAYVNWGT